MKLIVRLLISAISIFIASYILPGVKVESFTTALLVAVILGAINMFIKPLVLILTLPINIISLGFFTFVINGLIILLTSSLIKGFYVQNILWAILLSIIISIVNSFLNNLANNQRN